MFWKKQTNRQTKPVDPETKHIEPVEAMVFMPQGFEITYAPVMAGPSTLGALAESPETLRRAMEVVALLEPDDYISYLSRYYEEGLKRFGNAWRYADIITVLMACAALIRPSSYLEIGVRRGRSMAIVGSASPQCRLVGMDRWPETYAGMPNPGPEFVRSELKKVGHSGEVELISGDSHQELPAYFQSHPNACFDMITVDGDHGEQGAEQDILDVLPRLKLGGVLVFDDIIHPAHPYLMDVWQRAVANNKSFATWEHTDLGYGVALAIRRQV